MGKPAVHGIEEDAAEYGIRKEWNVENNRAEWTVTCGCGAWDKRPFTADTSPALMMKRWKQHGWTFAHHATPICQDCRTAHRKGPKPMAIIGPDLKLSRKVMLQLDTYFDTATHRYAEGWSDAAIANHVGCSAEIVAHIRVEAGYGEVEDPNSIAAGEIAAELDTLKDAAQGELEALRQEFTSAMNSVTDRFRNEVLALKSKHDQDITEALNLFNERHAQIAARVEPLVKKAS